MAIIQKHKLVRAKAPTPAQAKLLPKDATDVSATLDSRGSRYGAFTSHAKITQDLKDVMRATPGWDKLSPSQKEALEMNAHKIGRILNGDPNYADSWHDIAGYASLVDKELCGQIV